MYRRVIFLWIIIFALAGQLAYGDEIKGRIVSVNVPQESMVIADESGNEISLKVKNGVLTKKGDRIIAIQTLAVNDPVLVATEKDGREEVWVKEIQLLEGVFQQQSPPSSEEIQIQPVEETQPAEEMQPEIQQREEMQQIEAEEPEIDIEPAQEEETEEDIQEDKSKSQKKRWLFW